MFLISWNVAGWSSTSAAIRTCYGSLREFFDLTHADIICLQECKGIRSRLNTQPVEMGASDGPESAVKTSNSDTSNNKLLPKNATAKSLTKHNKPSHAGVEGWESFWSLSTPAHRGFNGVVTFVKKGLTWSCDARPFEQDELNDEGRLVVTEHSHFVLFNVYVPNARGGKRFAFKMQFLYSLQQVMNSWRSRTLKPIILVGDLNTTYRVSDAYWGLRRIHLTKVVALSERAEELNEDEWNSATPFLSKETLHRLSNMFTNFLCDYVCDTVHEMEEKNNNNSNNNNNNKKNKNAGSTSIAAHFAQASLHHRANDEHSKELGISSSPTIAVDGPRFDDMEIISSSLLTLYDKIVISHHSRGSVGESMSSKLYGLDFSEPPISLRELCDAGIVSTFTDDFYRRILPQHNRELYALVQYCGLPPHADSTVLFLSRLLHVSAQVACHDALVEPKEQHHEQYHGNQIDCPVLPESLQSTSPLTDKRVLRKMQMWDTHVLTNEVVKLCDKYVKSKIEQNNDSYNGHKTNIEVTSVITTTTTTTTSSNNTSNENKTNRKEEKEEEGGEEENLADSKRDELLRAARTMQAKQERYNLSICSCPYTCWDQSRNKRQTNEGTRIDYILIDTELVPFVQCMRATENNTGLHEPEMNVNSANNLSNTKIDNDNDNIITGSSNNNNNRHQYATASVTSTTLESKELFYGEFDGLEQHKGVYRATVNGAAPPAPFDGSGMPPVTGHAKFACFRGLPSTGLFVTMPQFSDHIGVCVLFDSERCTLLPRPGQIDERNECMYHPPITLLSFFNKAKTLKNEINDNGNDNRKHKRQRDEVIEL